MTDVIRCNRCIMDNSSDESITFDEHGYCDYCASALELKEHTYFPNEKGSQKLQLLLDGMRNSTGDFDCIMGISGGLDSSYLLFLGYMWGLRVLALHIDDGFDTELSKNNISKLVNKTKHELIVVKPDSDQFNGLTKAYMKASVPNLAIPQDNTIQAEIVKYAKSYRIKTFLSGENFALECILQRGNTYRNDDLVNLKDINKKFGDKPIDKLALISPYQKSWNKRLLNLETIRPLNYVDYNRDRAFMELSDFCGFEYYGGKHLENILTAFIQLFWFPKKFGVDKRTSHLSSMIVSGQLSREEALRIYESPMYDDEMLDEYVEIIKRKLEISDNDFECIMNAPSRQHNEFKVGNYRALFIAAKVLRKMRLSF